LAQGIAKKVPIHVRLELLGPIHEHNGDPETVFLLQMGIAVDEDLLEVKIPLSELRLYQDPGFIAQATPLSRVHRDRASGHGRVTPPPPHTPDAGWP